MRTKTFAAGTLLALALGSLSSVWLGDQASAQRNRWYRSAMVPAGTTIDVRLDSKISTEDARSGDAWSGTVSRAVISGDRILIPEGTPVEGVVTSSAQGTHNTRAQVDLSVRRITVNGQTRSLYADTPPIVAGSHRAKKLGAILGGAAAGALVGSAVDKGKGTVIGGVLGGAAGYGLTRHAFRTLQLKAGTVVTFTTRQDVALRR